MNLYLCILTVLPSCLGWSPDFELVHQRPRPPLETHDRGHVYKEEIGDATAEQDSNSSSDKAPLSEDKEGLERRCTPRVCESS